MDKHLFNSILKRKGITQKEFAEKLGISRMSLYNRLAGNVQWTLKEINATKVVLKLSNEEMQNIFFA